jgi:hypothetical protein
MTLSAAKSAYPALPNEYFIRLQNQRLNHLIIFTVLSYLTIYVTSDAIIITGSLGFASFITGCLIYYLFLYWQVLIGIHFDPSDPRIIPYFERKIPGSDTFFTNTGHAIAHSIQSLDCLAIEAGLKPLSNYGFEDEYMNGRSNAPWYGPEEGLETVVGLLKLLEERHVLFGDVDEVIKDLIKYRFHHRTEIS